MAASARPFDRALEHAVRELRPDLIVATYNLAAQALGRLVRQGRIATALVVYVTDAGPHPYWVTRSASLHLAFMTLTAHGLRGAGAERVEVVRPVLRPGADAPPKRREARAHLGLPAAERVCLVNGGSWAAGRLADTVRLLRDDATCRPYVLCGRDRRLADLVRSLPPAVAVPWTKEALRYLAAADVVVDNAGGQTCLEALACGTPVVIFRPLPGHGRLNARALAATGTATFARTPDQLLAAIRNPAPGLLPAEGRDPAEVILDEVRRARTAAP
jgi:UDP-N-acetylglucosamine:LPS N-acetylglucosamine transferase